MKCSSSRFGRLLLSLSSGVGMGNCSLVISFQRQNNSWLCLGFVMSGEGVERKSPQRLVKAVLAILFIWGQVNQHLPWNRSQLLKLLQKDCYKAANHHYWNIMLLHLLSGPIFSTFSWPTQHITLPRKHFSLCNFCSQCVLWRTDLWSCSFFPLPG